MKYLFSAVLNLFLFSAFSQCTIEWTFKGIQEGYDHINRIEIYVDGELVKVSDEFLESEIGKCTIPVSKGVHLITIKNFAKYEGVFEEHSVLNGYDLDTKADLTFRMKKKKKIKVEYDIDKSAILIK